MLPRLTRLLPARPLKSGPPLAEGPSLWPGPLLRLLSFNMQAGMAIKAPHHFLTRGHRHFLPHGQRHEHLRHIGEVLTGHDVVGLQEVDGGSLRSGYLHQLAHLAELAGFDWWFQQLNRDLGHLGQFSNGMLSRVAPTSVEAHALPGLPGRGVIMTRYGSREHSLVVMNAHMALSARTRQHQFGFMAELVGDAPHVVVMGDLNCTAEEWARSPLGRRAWSWLGEGRHTYPSWKPARQIDHILVSEGLRVRRADVLDVVLSDHRPVAVEIELPAGLFMPAPLPVPVRS
ncbi:MAG TPA: endonuclease/exonuclease/phosphatase family protein [Moraxellaceae bacterium]|nr:endonuclease/exonuclease/phosphatase family protein [Moraxellaceae bacterium]